MTNNPAVIITRVIEGHMPFVNWEATSPADRCSCDGCDWTGRDPAAHRIHQGQAAAEALGLRQEVEAFSPSHQRQFPDAPAAMRYLAHVFEGGPIAEGWGIRVRYATPWTEETP